MAPMEIPLLRSMWIRRKRGREVALRWRTNSSGEIQTVTESVEYADGTERKVRRPIIDIFEPTSASEVPDERPAVARRRARHLDLRPPSSVLGSS